MWIAFIQKIVTRLIGGPAYQYYVETNGDDSDLDGENMVEGVNNKPWFDNALWRVEIRPTTPRLEDHFLTVLTPSLDDFKNVNSGLLETENDNVYGTRNDGNLILFTDRDE